MYPACSVGNNLVRRQRHGRESGTVRAAPPADVQCSSGGRTHRAVGSVDGSMQCGAAPDFELFSQGNRTDATASMNATLADYS
jgi:hypothetical protein